jgi:hypothetical protein
MAKSVTKSVTKIDSGILQYVPKGAYYEGKDAQFNRVFEMWNGLFQYDRVLFALTMLLNGTRFSKGMMTHMLLSNPAPTGSGKDLVVEDTLLDSDFERRVIYHNLAKEKVPDAMKNLLILAGADSNAKRVNNARTRKLILEYIFNRPPKETDALAVNYKGKMKRLVRHALGKQTLFKVLNGDEALFRKYIGRYQSGAQPVMWHLFGVDTVASDITYHYPKIDQYQKLKQAAIANDVDAFRTLMKGMPMRTVVGFRNLYKVNIPLKDVYEKSKMSDREKLQMQTASKKAGAKVKVDYEKQDLYDLWKYFYHQIANGGKKDLDKVSDAIDKQGAKIDKIDIGECVCILDASHSMQGSKERPLHPFLTSLSIISTLDNVKDIIYVGGAVIKEGSHQVVYPAGGSPLWRGLVDAVLTGAKKIVVFSDGYENAVKGMFDKAYQHFQDTGYEFELLHINPVFSADAKKGTGRKLAEGVDPMPVENYKYLETELIFNRMIENTGMVRKLLVSKYRKLIGG